MREGLEVRRLAAVVCGRNIWKKERSLSGLSWQASRIAGSEPAPTRLSTNASRCDGCGSDAQSPITRMRQVEQRARPPHTLACGTLLRRLASSTLRPFGTPDYPAIAIGQADHAAPPLVQRAGALCQQHTSDQGEITDQEVILDGAQYGLLGRRADLIARKILRPPFG